MFRGAMGGAQFLAPTRRLFFTDVRRDVTAFSPRDSMFVTLIAFLLRAHVNSLLVVLRNANICRCENSLE